ncbi:MULTISPECIES: DUF2255 family protein [Streptomyces]|uniref:DUF2255 family protein n=1 Tax=Streptomyces canarius TaxID=285453 RepID=A0ABQ3DFT0_9ACTN|nr:DUF2255 family protein [Streptomyces canarius]GHA71250.1 hypothetical protein GCM10010345_87980 [Streptomyces canarius]
MNTWNTQALRKVAGAEELHIAPRRDDGSLREPTTIWVVADGDNLYVRSWRGTSGAWWNTARISRAGHIRAGGIDADVTFTPVDDPAVNDRVDAAYQTKYGRYTGYVEPMISEQARATTLRLHPQT